MSAFDPNIARALKPPSRVPWVVLALGLTGAGAGSYSMYRDRQQARTDEAAEAQKLTAAEAEKKDLGAKVEKLEAEKTELATAKDELAKAKDELTKDVASKSDELAQLKGTHDKLEAQMKDEIAKGNIVLTQSGGRLRVDLVDKILFDSGEAQISKRGEGVLAKVGAVLATIDDKQIQVSGHTDKTPISDKLTDKFPTNWELSAARAITVVRFLQEKAGVPGERLVASGYGENHPIANNKTVAGRARNRRIEILLLPSLAPKAMSRSKLRVAEAEAAKDAKDKDKEKDKDKDKDKVAKAKAADSHATRIATRDVAKGKKRRR